ncbi:MULTISPECIES: heme-binding protein [unclassified Streptomyces]|uniref:GlcG/HbpS family heme-binding protein n=1 Tax=unclassified Streptomyces TaxID=2593676 RepID=UPI00168BCC58|nr:MULTISPECIES: heme-binding protein [unclassified Streptomyces]MBD3004921.1 heme-binding protein [Streptomyces sp. 5-10]
MNLDLGTALVSAARAEAMSLGVPMAIAVVDTGGALVAFARMDGTPFPLAEVAIGKAYTAAAFARPSAEVAEVFAGRVQFTTSISVATDGRVMFSKGGVPVFAGGALIGGIGASGGTGQQDLTVVEAAVASVLPTEATSLPADVASSAH